MLLEVLEDVSLCGFPADLLYAVDGQGVWTTGEFYPTATCLNGTISALRPFDSGEPAIPENSHIIQYDLPVVAGTSGSAVWDADGRVIGINSSRIGNQGDFTFAIRVDVLEPLLTAVELGEQGAVLAEVEVEATRVTDAMRDACADLDDARIEEALLAYEDLRGQGYTQTSAIAISLAACDTNCSNLCFFDFSCAVACEVVCDNCHFTIIDEVYGP